MNLSYLCAIALILTVSLSASEDNEELLSKRPPKDQTETLEELKDMLVIAMQNMVSNNDLVTQLTQNVVQNMLSVGENKKELETLKVSHSEEIAKLRLELEETRAELQSQIENGESELRTLLEVAETKFNSSLETVSSEIKQEISLISSEVTILSAEEGLREERCAKVCAGTTGRGRTNWSHYSSAGLHVTVDISKCGFVSVPTITTALEGSSSHWTHNGGSEVYSGTATSFQTYIHAVNSDLRGRADEYEWNMEWIAVGYIC